MSLIRRVARSRAGLAVRDWMGWRPWHRPRVLGVGWPKTGTTTLKDCLCTLGYRPAPYRIDLIDRLCEGHIPRIMHIAKRYECFKDWPWFILFREFDRAFPGMKFVLTVREPTQWLGSYMNSLSRPRADSEAMNRRRRALYGIAFPNPDPAELIARYTSHIAAVEEHFRNRPNDLLVVNWESGDGWAQLAPFLGHPVPNRPFPHANRGTYVSDDCAPNSANGPAVSRSTSRKVSAN